MSQIEMNFSKTPINPPIGTELSGYGYYLHRKCESVLDSLYLRLLFLKNKDTSILFINFDLIGASRIKCDDWKIAITQLTDIPTENIFITFTHTHSGPAVTGLKALGQPDNKYLKKLESSIISEVVKIQDNTQACTLSYFATSIDKMSFNRRSQSALPLDKSLLGLSIEGKSKKIILYSFACHPVVIGKEKLISADWPGAVSGELLKAGFESILLQGFAGNIDPIINLKSKGKGTPKDLVYYGLRLANKILKEVKEAKQIENNHISSKEIRFKLPLQVPKEEDLAKDENLWKQKYQDTNPAHNRFYQGWLKVAKLRFKELSADSFVHNIPIQCLIIGDIKFLFLPSEVDCEYAIKLKTEFSNLMTVGYSGGLVGYFPNQEAYDNSTDYACYNAPKFFGNLFPFENTIEEDVLNHCRSILSLK